MQFGKESPGGLRFTVDKVDLLAYILIQIEQLYRAILKIFQQLVRARPNGATRALATVIGVMREMPEDGPGCQAVLFPLHVAFNHPGEADAVNVLRRLQRQPRHLQQRGIKVGTGHRDVTDQPPRPLLWPVHNQRHADAAFIQPALGAPQRQVGCGVGDIEVVQLTAFPAGLARLATFAHQRLDIHGRG